MELPEPVLGALQEIGQVAAEVYCRLEGFREYVTIYMAKRNQIMNVEDRFPYFSKCPFLYRVCRFRVRAELVGNDTDVSRDDLYDLQEIYLPSAQLVGTIVSMWLDDLHVLAAPSSCEIPV